ncbi:MAG: ABC transporter permease, partial [Gemmatimonadales bacterium]
EWIPAMVRVIEGDYFDVLGVPLLAGRTFNRLDDEEAPPVAIISESLARLVHGDEDPLGRRFTLVGEEFTVVGVVGNVAYEANGAEFEKVYVSHGQYADDRIWGLTYTVKTTVPPAQLIQPARRELAAIDPALVLYQPRPLEAVIGQHRARDQFTLFLMAVFAAVALTLAAVGIYGVLSYAVSQRTHEIGVRMALGARPAQVQASVVGQGLFVAGLGILVGLAGAFALSRVLESVVFEVSTQDPRVFTGMVLLLVLVVLVASLLPARRATRVDPLDALRAE